MSEFDFRPQTEQNDSKSKAKTFWKNVGLIAIALMLAVLTVVMIFLNR